MWIVYHREAGSVEPHRDDGGGSVPFKKITSGKKRGKYRSPSGRTYTAKQVRAYYATGGWKRPVRRKRRR